MKLNELKPKEGSVKMRTRVGRGIGSGKGKTCGRGVKGQKSRNGVAINGFEGGQMPLYQRLPKRGFRNIFAKRYAVVTLDRLQKAIDAKKIDAKKTIDETALIAGGVITNARKDGVKLIGDGDFKAKVELKINAITKPAAAIVEKSGGKVDLIPVKEAGPKNKKQPGSKAKKEK